MIRRGSSPVRRATRRQRFEKDRVLIVCEGKETEPNYFDFLRRSSVVKDRYDVKLIPGRGNPVETLHAAIRQIQRISHQEFSYEHKWCVFDVETAVRHELVREACALALRYEFNVCLSNPAFEIWYVLHFDRITKSFSNAGSLRTHLQKLWKKNFSQRYDKNNPDHYQKLVSRMSTAIDNAKWGREQSPDHGSKTKTIDCNAATDVYKLVELLTNPPDSA